MEGSHPRYECRPVDTRKIDFVFHSNRIEDIQVPVNELVKREEARPNEGHLGAFNYLMDLAAKRRPLTWENICFAQKLITNEQVGDGVEIEERFRGRVRGENERVAIGLHIIEPPSPQALEQFIKILEGVCSQSLNQEEIIRAAAGMHVDFESMHPFMDGNGRTGRLLVCYALAFHDLPIVVFSSAPENRSRYYKAFPPDQGAHSIGKYDCRQMEEYLLDAFKISEERYGEGS